MRWSVLLLGFTGLWGTLPGCKSGSETQAPAAVTDTGSVPADTVDVLSPSPDTATATDAAPDAGSDGTTPTDLGAEDANQPPAEKSVCVAIRGNGELITAHFAALARIAETFGPFDGVAGGSSASITSFFTESMHLHPGLKTCGKASCTKLEAGSRLGLMYKSLYGYIAAMGERDEAVAVTILLGVVEQAKTLGIGGLVDSGKLKEALDALITLLSSPDVKDLVNKEIFDLLLDSPEPTKHVAEVWSALSTLGSFKADSTVIFLRPGVVSFPGFAEKLGRIGSFYAAYGPVDLAAWEAFFQGCATPGRGKTWPEVAALDLGNGTTCGAHFKTMLGAWRDGFIPAEKTEKNRIDDLVGAHMRAVAITSALTGANVAAWNKAREAYLKAEPWTLELGFDDVHVGYFGSDAVTSLIVKNPRGYADLKSKKAKALGQVPWRLALSLSPAEPGLARAVAIDSERVSAGGWPDLEPVLALRNAGCDRVIYVTRRGASSPFARAVAGLAGMSPEQDKQIHDLNDPKSSFSLSLSEAAGVWCTDWNAFSLTQLPEIVYDSWNAPFELHDPTWKPLQGDFQTTTLDRLDIIGCTPPTQ